MAANTQQKAGLMTPEWEPRVKSLEDTLKSFMDSQAGFNERLFAKIDASEASTSTKIDAISKPNYNLLISLIGLIVVIMGACLAATILPLQNDIRHLYDTDDKSELRMSKIIEKLDEKLQREFGLTLAATKEDVEKLSETGNQRHGDLQEQIRRVQTELDNVTEWKDGQLRDDLNELRVRRYHKEMDFQADPVKPKP